MKAGIHISSVWRDADLVELAIGLSDGTSFFSNQVYVGYDALKGAVASLDALRDQVRADRSRSGSTRPTPGPP